VTLRLKALLTISALSIFLWAGIISGGVWMYRNLNGERLDTTVTASVH